MPLRVLLTGGGTGGHINPALAIADIIKMNAPDAQIAFVGTERGLENKLVPKEGYHLYHIQIQGIKRSLSLGPRHFVGDLDGRDLIGIAFGDLGESSFELTFDLVHACVIQPLREETVVGEGVLTGLDAVLLAEFDTKIG